MKLKGIIFAGVSVAALSHSVAAAGEPVTFEIEAKDLAAALNDFGQQSNRDMLFSTDAVAGKSAKAVEGVYEPEEALSILLTNTGLNYSITSKNAILVSAVAQESSTLSTVSSGSAADENSSDSAPDENDDAVEETPEEEVGIDSITVVGSRNTDLRRLESDPQPYIVFDREQIAKSGANTLSEFIGRSLNAASSLTGGNTTSISRGDSSRSSIALRGLSERETLILVDGRRIPENRFVDGGVGQPDLNGIPLSAVERIEVLASTASGIYGGSATGGVINVILKRDYSGLELGFTYDTAIRFDTSDTRVDLSGGFNLENGKTNVSYYGSFSNGTELSLGERNFLERTRSTLLQNNPSGILNPGSPPLGATTNIGSRTGGNLTLLDGTDLGSPITFVPVGYGGVSTDGGAALVANAGNYNLDIAPTAQTNGADDVLRLAPTIYSFGGTVNRDFTSWLNIFAEGSFSENSSTGTRSVASPAFFRLNPGVPGNPFQQPITISFPQRGGVTETKSSLKTTRLGAGFTADIPESDWFVAGDYTWNKTKNEFDGRLPIDIPGLNTALNSGTLDFTSDIAITATDFSSFSGAELAAATSFNTTDTSLAVAALRTGGSLPISLPGGKIKLNALFEYRDETYDQAVSTSGRVIGGMVVPTTQLAPEQSQEVLSGYSEVLFPLVSPDNNIPGVSALEFQVAVRYDDYSISATNQTVNLDANGDPVAPLTQTDLDFTEFSPTFAVKYSPFEDLSIRASYGEGFLPPSLVNLAPGLFPFNFPSFIFGLVGVTDPLRGDTPVGAGSATGLVLISGGGSPDLTPEESKSLSIGAIYEPRWLEGLRISVDWTRIEKSNAIIPGISFFNAAEVAAVILNRPDRIDREPVAPSDPFDVGPIIGLNTASINLAEEEVQAIDYSVDYTRDTDQYGQFTFRADLTHNLKADRIVVPGADAVDRVGTDVLVKFRGTASLEWNYDNWTVQWATQYVDKINLDRGQPGDAVVIASQGADFIESQLYHDLYVSYRFDDTNSILSNTTIQFGAINIFDKKPPFSAERLVTNPGIAPYGDVRLARLRFSIRKSF